MKVLAIRGKNLASLEGCFEIDFTIEPLKSAGIFAITGNTGSGKSTILDALCLALFDKTPRIDRAAENSIQIADVKDKTINQKDCRSILRRGTSDGYAEVDFISLAGESFRSRWSVRRSRNKVDGSLRSSECSLINLTTNTEIQGVKSELLSKIVDLIGLTFYQFTRAVLLAQGDFATFLKATQKEKAELLEKLTGTDIYSRISMLIYEKSKIAEQELNLLKERIKDVDLLSDKEQEDLSIEKQEIIANIAFLETEIAVLNAKIKWIVEQESLKEGITQAEQLLLNFDHDIEQAKPRYNFLCRIDSVQEIRDVFNELKNSQKQLANNKTTLVNQEFEKSTNENLLKQITDKFIACESEQKQYNELLTKIAPQIRQARELDLKISLAKVNIANDKAEYEQVVDAKLKLEQSIENVKNAITTTERNIAAINNWFNENEQYKDVILRVDLIINLLNDVSVANVQGANNSNILTDSLLILNDDLKRLSDLQIEMDRLNNLLPAEVTIFRERLLDGEPCPVCGSLHHPFSGIIGESIREQELSRAKKETSDRITLLTNNIDKRNGENIRLQSIIENYKTQSKEIMTKLSLYLGALPLWEEKFKQGVLQNTLKEISVKWNDNIAELTKINEHIINLQTTLNLAQNGVLEAYSACSIKEQKYKDGVANLENMQKDRDVLIKGKSVDEVEKICSDKAKLLLDNLTKITNDKNTLIAANEKCAGAIAQIVNELSLNTERCNTLNKKVNDWILFKDGEFTFEQLCDLLQKENNWIAREREALNKIREGRASAQATLVERNKILEEHYQLQSRPLEGEMKDILQNRSNEKVSELQQKNSRNAQIDMLFVNHKKGKDKIRLFEQELNQKEILSQNWEKLSYILGSADGAKFKVLAQGYTLDALLLYANKHLHELSKRYELQRIPDTLALQVSDLDMFGEIRTVHSLSGGESFLISLALALGLSSLSSNRMKIESLFIDEGFGSLDIDTLCVAMNALEGLQTQGRKIGVISHVSQMTERINTQIKVVKTANGKSKIEVIG